MGTCDFTGITYPTINEIVRMIRTSSTLIGMLLYIPITIKLRQVNIFEKAVDGYRGEKYLEDFWRKVRGRVKLSNTIPRIFPHDPKLFSKSPSCR